jgi:hypothetical protein
MAKIMRMRKLAMRCWKVLQMATTKKVNGSIDRLRFGLRLRRQMEVVGRAEAFLVAEELEEGGVECVGGAEKVVEGGLEDRAQGVERQVHVREPAAGAQANALGGIELDRKAVEGGGLGTEKLADFGDGSPGRSEVEGAA